jgi:superfamily II DNA or RNA helicase
MKLSEDQRHAARPTQDVRLEDLKPGARVLGLSPHGPVAVLSVQWHGSDVAEVVFKGPDGQVGNELVYRSQESDLALASKGQSWTFLDDAELLRLVSEAQRIRWAHLFDPYIAVNTSLVEPLPHQVTAVYGEMLPRQPLRYMLADDPGSGKTIMTGLYIKELVIRGDLERCLIVVPGSLVEQWQDELYQKFDLPFDILTRDLAESARTGNIFRERNLLVARLDQIARGDDLKAMLDESDWDLVVVDEAHKMSATYFGGEVKYTKRYRLGEMLSGLTRHFLLLTATPHNGKERDFQLFLALLDADRFEGKYRPDTHESDASDLMRRMVKEELVRFDGTPLFPERRAYTVSYKLSDAEAVLYREVTNYVREEFNRADRVLEGGRRGTVGFALTVLQRRLASSPAAIYASLKRRRERLESNLRDARLEHRVLKLYGRELQPADFDDLDDLPAEELERLEEELVDEATAARTVEELKLEIEHLKQLEQFAREVLRDGQDRKWDELSRLIQEQDEMFTVDGRRRKLVIFTEHRDTLDYLTRRIRTLLGRPEAVVTIQGGMRRDLRRQTQEAFTQDKDVHILVATDAAGEGINLQRAHLMINYDLPWNPNRLEQRFGRIHRIGQTEVCHLWNLVADETREGDVYQTLLRKLEQERASLGGAVFDVLGKAIQGTELRSLLLDAIRYGDQPEVRAALSQKVEGALDHERLQALMAEEALAHDVLDADRLTEIKVEMQRAQARRLQPHYIASFFVEAFERLGGTLYAREPGRYEITHVPARVRNRARRVGTGSGVLRRYERICFEKDAIRRPGKPVADLVAPGHPLLDAVLDLTLEMHRPLLKKGAVLVDDADPGETMRALVYLEHTIADGRTTSSGRPSVTSRRFQFVEMPVFGEATPSDPVPDGEGDAPRDAGPAPYLNYRPPSDEEERLLGDVVAEADAGDAIEQRATSFAIQHIVPGHVQEVRAVRGPRIQKAMQAVHRRLTKEISYWDHRAEELRLEEEAGKVNAKLNAARARQRADDLQARLQRRMSELKQEKQLSARPPNVLGSALVVPAGLLRRLRGERVSSPDTFARATERVERVAMETVMAVERQLGFLPRDVGPQKLGYDVESRPRDGQDARLRFIEVKGRIEGARTVTLTRNEILTALNRPDDWFLALVEVPKAEDLEEGEGVVVGEPTGVFRVADLARVRYVTASALREDDLVREPGFAENSTNCDWDKLWAVGEQPLAGAVM